MNEQHDPVIRNRATPPRRTPGRVPLGAALARRLVLLVTVVLIAATAVLVATLVSA